MNGERFNLAAARLDRGLSQRDLAAEIGIGRETIRRLESGLTAHPRNAKKVADFFGIQVTDLMPLDPEGVAA